MNQKPKLGILALAKINQPKADIESALAYLKSAYGSCDTMESIVYPELLMHDDDILEAVHDMQIRGADCILFVVGTWIYSSLIVEAVNDLALPYILFGLSDKKANGNLGAALQIRYVLQEMGKTGLFIYGRVEDEENQNKIAKYARAAWVKRSLRNKKIATIGGKCMMMYQTQVNEFCWKRVFGVDFPQYDTVQIMKEMEEISDEEATPVAEEFKSKFTDIITRIPETGEYIASDAILSQAKMCLAFRRFAKRHGIEAFANKCMPEMAHPKFGYKYLACMATSMLNDSGIVTACEADMPAAVTMLLLKRLVGEQVFFADIAKISPNGESIAFFNCGSAPVSMADRKKPVVLIPNTDVMADEGVADDERLCGSDLERGACTRFELECDRKVTIMRVGGNEDTLRFHAATAITEDRFAEKYERFPGFGLHFNGNSDEFLQKTVGHHYVLVFGDHIEEIKYLAQMYNVHFTWFDGIAGVNHEEF